MLKDTLQEMKAASAGQTPPEIMETMLNSRKTLSNSDILSRVIKVGDKMPDFSLADENGKQVGLAKLLQNGPVAISLYRGVW